MTPGAQLGVLGRQILAGQIRHLFTIAGTAAIAHGVMSQGQAAQAIPVATEYVVGTLMVSGPMALSAIGKIIAHGNVAAAVAALRGSPCPSAQSAPIATTKENDMSIGSELRSVLGIVLGILIPGTSASTTNLTTTIQNEIAKVYGEAATAMAKELSLDTTGMSGPDKVFAIVKALVATAEANGFKGDLKVFGDVAVDIAQAAYRASEPTFGSDIVALASALTANPLVTVAATLVGQVVQAEADKTVAAAAA